MLDINLLIWIFVPYAIICYCYMYLCKRNQAGLESCGKNTVIFQCSPYVTFLIVTSGLSPNSAAKFNKNVELWCQHFLST